MVFIECERLIVFFCHRRIYIQILAMRNKPNCVIRTFLFQIIRMLFAILSCMHPNLMCLIYYVQFKCLSIHKTIINIQSKYLCDWQTGFNENAVVFFARYALVVYFDSVSAYCNSNGFVCFSSISIDRLLNGPDNEIFISVSPIF